MPGTLLHFCECLPMADDAAHGSPGLADVTLFVCTACKRAQPDHPDGEDRPGGALVAALAERLTGAPGITVTPVDCLCVCKRPCTLALKADGKFTYMIGDLDPAIHADEIVAATLAYQRSSNGIVAWRERPQCFRKGVIARVPPLGFIQPEPPAS
jgi:predicted metal-binding protein